MPAKPAPLKRIAICVHPKLGEANQDAALIAAYFQDNGLQAEYSLLSDDSFTARIRQGEFDLMIALGGDGTMLRAGHICGPAKVPILGINIGRFGFLTEIHRDKWETVMPKLLAGEYWLERRMMLCADQLRDKKSIGQWEVLNEVWIGRGQIVRPVHLDADVDGRFLTTYVAWLDRFHTNRFNSVCTRCGRANLATRAAHYPARTSGSTPIYRPFDCAR